MGFQSAINNILGTAAGATIAAKSYGDKKAKEAEAEKKAGIEAQAQEKADIEEAQKKMSDATQMAIGYKQEDLDKREAAEAMGIQLPQKNPRGVSNATYERRVGNAKAMEEIQARYIQNKEFRERLKGIKTKALAAALKTEINKKGGKK